MPLTRDMLVTGKPMPRVVEVPIPALGDTTFVRELSGTERDQFEDSLVASKANFRARILVACVCDENGVDLFKVTDVEHVGKLPASVLEPAVRAALKLNGLSPAAVEDAEKNSVTPPSADSRSDSPATLA